MEQRAFPLCVVQARMGSTRLPGKVLRDCAGRPLLDYLIERLRRCGLISGVVVATSDAGADDPIEAFCAARGVPCHRGPEGDVAGRMLGAIERFGASSFVRVCGDSPLLDPALVDRAAALRGTTGADLVTNIRVRSFPKGQSVEVLDGARFAAAVALMTDPYDREHVTPYFYRHPDAFRIVDFRCAEDLGEMQLSVDTADDFERVAALLAAMDRPHWTYGLDELTATAGGRAGSGDSAPRRRASSKHLSDVADTMYKNLSSR